MINAIRVQDILANKGIYVSLDKIQRFIMKNNLFIASAQYVADIYYINA